MSKNNAGHDEVVEMVRRLLPEEPALANELQDQIARRRLVSQLADLRNLKGISQQDVAEQLGCTQSKVSKIENGCDENLSIGVLLAYARLVDSDLTILFSSKEDSLVSQIKYHAMCIKSCFGKMNELVRGDSKISEGVAEFHLEALVNLVRIVDDARKSLRSKIPPSAEPQVRLQVQDIKAPAPAPPLPSGDSPKAFAAS